MNHRNEKAQSAPAVSGLLQTTAAPAPSVLSDRLYQIAAATAGLFLLATLL